MKLRVSHLRKQFSNVVAVDDVSFELQGGEIFGLLGPNGAGKTTSIRVILNILEPEGGEVTYDGLPFSERTRDLIGYLPEERGLYRKQRLLDTLLYFAELRGMHTSRAKSEALKWLKRLDLLQYADTRIDELSKGNQQKAQFITAVVHAPPLVVLDEPFSGLDPVNQIMLKDILLGLRHEGKAIIFSTHQMEQAERLSDSICLINKGRVVLQGSIRDVKRRYGSNTLYLEFTGDGDFLKSIPGIRGAQLYQNSAELRLDDHVTTAQILPSLTERLDVRKFELLEPSLQSIFIDVVTGPKNAGAGDEHIHPKVTP